MFVSSDLLARLRAARTLRQANVSDYKVMKTAVWAEIRTKYGVPDTVKLSVELDGAKAGELRVKGTGQPWVPAPAAQAAAPAADRPAFVITTRAGVQMSPVYGIDGLIASLRDEFGLQVAKVN